MPDKPARTVPDHPLDFLDYTHIPIPQRLGGGQQTPEVRKLGRDPEFLADGSGVFLDGVYTFDELLAVVLDNRLRSDV